MGSPTALLFEGEECKEVQYGAAGRLEATSRRPVTRAGQQVALLVRVVARCGQTAEAVGRLCAGRSGGDFESTAQSGSPVGSVSLLLV